MPTFTFLGRPSAIRRTLSLIVVLTVVAPIAPASAAPSNPVPAIDPVLTVAALGTSVARTRAVKSFVGAPIPRSRFPRPGAAPRAFVPFPIVDGNGKSVAPSQASTVTITTPTGAQMTAGAYWAQVNAYEKQLNAYGESLRDGTIDDGALSGSSAAAFAATGKGNALGPAKLTLGPHYLAKLVSLGTKRIVVSAGTQGKAGAFKIAPNPSPTPTAGSTTAGLQPLGPIPKPTFNAGGIKTPLPHGMHSPPPTPPGGFNTGGQPNIVGSSGPPPSPNPSICSLANNQSAAIGQAVALGVSIENAACPTLTNIPPGSVPDVNLQFSDPWTYSKGDPSTAQFSIDANLSLTSDPAHTPTTSAQAYADVATQILGTGDPGDLFNANAQFVGQTLSVTVMLFGATAYSTTSATSYNYDDPVTFFNVQVDIPILFFDVILTASGGGDFGVNFDVAATNGSVSASVTPFINLTASFSAGIGIDIVVASVSVGIDTDLNIAAVQLPIALSAGYSLNMQQAGSAIGNGYIGCQLLFQHALTLDFDYQLLSGDVNLFAKACFIGFCDTATHNLYNWPGIHGDVNIVNDRSGLTPVGPDYTFLPGYGIALAAGQAYTPEDTTGPYFLSVCDQLSALAQ